MRRYYKTDNATRSFRSGGFEFQFEPTVFRAGAWAGLLAVDDEAAQLALAPLIYDGGPIRELTAEEFEAQKKKTTGVTSSQRWRDPSVSLLPKAAESAPRVEAAPPQPEQSSTATESAEIRLAETAPVDELAEDPKPKRAKKK